MNIDRIYLFDDLSITPQFFFHSAGANHNVKNDKGDTPYDLAVKGGYENIVKKFAAVLGQSQLEKMIRPKNKGY